MPARRSYGENLGLGKATLDTRKAPPKRGQSQMKERNAGTLERELEFGQGCKEIGRAHRVGSLGPRVHPAIRQPKAHKSAKNRLGHLSCSDAD
jgi:hypothetical protein